MTHLPITTNLTTESTIKHPVWCSFTAAAWHNNMIPSLTLFLFLPFWTLSNLVPRWLLRHQNGQWGWLTRMDERGGGWHESACDARARFKRGINGFNIVFRRSHKEGKMWEPYSLDLMLLPCFKCWLLMCTHGCLDHTWMHETVA